MTDTNVADQLAKLAALHQAGSLSDAEFETAKAKLLGSSAQPPPQPPARAWPQPTRPPLPQTANHTKAPKAPKRRKRRHRVFFTLAAFVVFVVVVAVVASSGSGGPSAKITHTVESVYVLDAQHVRVYVMWDNIGKGTGNTSCTITVTAYNAFGDEIGSGFDTTSPNNPLKPGQTTLQYQDIVVTDNHAAGVTSTKDVSITDCS